MTSLSTAKSRHLSPFVSRDLLIQEHLPQVRLIARRIQRSLPPSVSLDDLISAGTVGLIGAIDRYDANHSVKLKTYAEYKIRGAILDSLRTLDWAPRQKRRQARLLERTISRLENESGRTPAAEEIAADLGISLEKYQTLSADRVGLTLNSLEQSSSDEKGRDLLHYLAGSEEEWPSQLFERAELRRLLAAALEKIPRRERLVLVLYFYEEMTLRDIAKVVRLHESRLSQLKSQAIARLRSYMSDCQPLERASVRLPRRAANHSASRREIVRCL